MASSDLDRRICALGSLSVLTDEIINEIIGKLAIVDILRLSCVSSVMNVFCYEEPLWLQLCMNQKLDGMLVFNTLWRQTALDKLAKEKGQPPPTLGSRLHFNGFTSLFLYRRWYRCHMALDNFATDSNAIERRSGLTVGEFSAKYDGQKPVILTDLTDNWPARNGWAWDQLVERYADVAFKVSQAHGQQVRMRLADYVDYMTAQHDEEPLYIFDGEFGERAPGLLEDFEVPHLFKEDLYDVLTHERPPYRWLVGGPARSGASWHVDPSLTSAWNALLVGQKRWAFYPPGKVPPGVTLHIDEASGEVDFDGPSSLQWWLDIYPTLLPAHRPLEVTQQPGETIFVPSGWWHCVLNLEPAVAVTQNVVNSTNFETVCLDMAPGYHHRGIARAGQLALWAQLKRHGAQAARGKLAPPTNGAGRGEFDAALSEAVSGAQLFRREEKCDDDWEQVHLGEEGKDEEEAELGQVKGQDQGAEREHRAGSASIPWELARGKGSSLGARRAHLGRSPEEQDRMVEGMQWEHNGLQGQLSKLAAKCHLAGLSCPEGPGRQLPVYAARQKLRSWLRLLWNSRPDLRTRLWQSACLGLHADVWLHEVEEVCLRHNLPVPQGQQRLPLGSGSNPVYLLESHAVKLYAEVQLGMSNRDRLFMELNLYQQVDLGGTLLQGAIPKLVASGILLPAKAPGDTNATPGEETGAGPVSPLAVRANLSSYPGQIGGSLGWDHGQSGPLVSELEKFGANGPGKGKAENGVRAASAKHPSREWVPGGTEPAKQGNPMEEELPYVVTEQCHGSDKVVAHNSMTEGDLMALAEDLGKVVRDLHLLPLPPVDLIPFISAWEPLSGLQNPGQVAAPGGEPSDPGQGDSASAQGTSQIVTPDLQEKSYSGDSGIHEIHFQRFKSEKREVREGSQSGRTSLIPEEANRSKQAFDENSESAKTGGSSDEMADEVAKKESRVPREWQAFILMLRWQRQAAEQRLRSWGVLPEALLSQLSSYLPEDSARVAGIYDGQFSAASWLHTDVMEDNILLTPVSDGGVELPDLSPKGCQMAGPASLEGSALATEASKPAPPGEGRVDESGRKWKLRWLIDFGNVMLGDPLYDIMALHLSVFRCSTKLLAHFLLHYGLPLEGVKSPPGRGGVKEAAVASGDAASWPLAHGAEPCGPSQKISSGDVAEVLVPAGSLRVSCRALCYCLLNDQDAMSAIFRFHESLLEATSLEAIEEAVWGPLNLYPLH